MSFFLAQEGLPFQPLQLWSYGVVLTVLVCILSAVGGLLYLAWKLSTKRTYVSSPYGSLPMRRAIELSYSSIGKIYLYMTGLNSYDNRMFNIHRAAVCPDTGRVFPDVIDFFNRMHLDWSFLKKRHPGNWISWGSLSTDQKEDVMRAHDSLDGFQYTYSSKNPGPRQIEGRYALSAPGPLYVDLETYTLLGWKNVPGTDLEVLIVQKPSNWLFAPKKDRMLKKKKKKKVKKYE